MQTSGNYDGATFAPRHLLVLPVEWLIPSFTLISRISYFPFLFQRKNIKLKDTCMKMFTVVFLKMENLQFLNLQNFIIDNYQTNIINRIKIGKYNKNDSRYRQI